MQAKKIFFVFLFSPKEEAVKADRRSDAHKGEAEKVRKSTKSLLVSRLVLHKKMLVSKSFKLLK